MTEAYRVLLFARYAELLGGPDVRVTLSAPTTVSAVCDALRQLPGGASLPDTLVVAVNGQRGSASEAVHPADELALLPPMAGG